MHSRAKKISTAAAAVILMLGLSACGGDSTGAVDKPTGDKSATPKNDSGRPLGANPDAMTMAIKAALSADKVTFTDGVYRAYVKEGDAESPASWTNCALLQTLDEGQNLIVVFPAGELDCSQRPTG